MKIELMEMSPCRSPLLVLGFNALLKYPYLHHSLQLRKFHNQYNKEREKDAVERSAGV